ncbi:MAG TPA: hypothetical protein VK789_26855 [Bryobacteraceae bacterium]|nr:hypothetical protein [Bryobacteraceae bacterium]
MNLARTRGISLVFRRIQLRLTLLLILLASVLPAQYATVQNAVGPSTQPSIVFASSIFDVLTANGILSELVGFATLPPQVSPKIVSPGMLALLTWGPIANPFPVITNGLPAPIPPTLPVTVSVRSWGSAISTRLRTTSVTAYSVTFVVPRNIPLGGAEIEYKVAGMPTGWTTVNVIPADLELYRIGSTGPFLAQSIGTDGSPTSIGLTTPAQPGQTIRLSGSGLGVGTAVSVTVGGVPATLVNAQMDRYQPGLDEILFKIPLGTAVADGCYVPLAVTYNKTTITSTISKTSNGAPCVHPFQLSAADMKTLDNGGYLAVGSMSMNTRLQVVTANAVSRVESAQMLVMQMSAAQLASYFMQYVPAPGCGANVLTPNFIAFAGLVLSSSPISTGSPPPIPDLGSISLQNGPADLMLTSDQSYFDSLVSTEGPLSTPPAPVIAGGQWTWQSAGSADLAASSFTFTLPAPIQLNGGAPFSFIRNQDQMITWNAASFDSSAILTATLSGPQSGTTTRQLSCSVPANSGKLTIPASLLDQFAGGNLGTLQINIGEPAAAMPHALLKLKNGTTLLMLVTSSPAETIPADIQ